MPLVTPTITPIVYVKEVHIWEYKIVVRESEPRDMVDEAELNALGADGWEMTGIVTKPGASIYYFKRLKP